MTDPLLTRLMRRRWKSRDDTAGFDDKQDDAGEAENLDHAKDTGEAVPSSTSDVTVAENTAYLRTARTPLNSSAFTNLERSTTARSDSSTFIRDAAREGAAPFSLTHRTNTAMANDGLPQMQQRSIKFAEKASHSTSTQSMSAHLTSGMQALRHPNWPAMRRTLAHEGLVTLKAFANAPTISLIISLTIALVNPLKALFITVPNYPFATAPDGKPPLDVIMEITSFLGGAAVPTSLVVLGAALSRIKVPRPISKLPLKAILALTICRMLLLPIAGIGIVQGLAHANIIARDNHVLRFSLLILSCTPSATNQLILSTLVAPSSEENNSEIFGAFLIAQYAALFVAMTVVAAYSISLIFG